MQKITHLQLRLQMRIIDKIFPFAHLRCHNEWASNILIMVTRTSMPIYYVIIKDGQNKKSHLLFSNSIATPFSF